MAVKRMFSTAIMQSTRFLRLSAEARCLYLGINMLADDEGVSEAYVAMLTQRVDPSALDELIDKGFVKMLDPDDLIVYVVDWDTHNQLRADRITPSLYHDLLDSVIGTKKESAEECPSDAEMSSCCQPADNPPSNVSEMSADCGEMSASCGELSADCQQSAAECPHSIGEGSIGEYSTGKDSIEYVSAGRSERVIRAIPSLEEVERYVKGKGYDISVEKFYAYHAQSDWKKVTNWKAAVDYWALNEYKHTPIYDPRKEDETDESIRQAILLSPFSSEAANG